MKYYPVPFSAREETPFIFGLAIREMLWLGGGAIVGLVAALLVFVIIGAKLQYFILCLPLMVPFIGLSFFISRKRVKEDDRYATLDRHLLKKIRYRNRPHVYLNFRRED